MPPALLLLREISTTTTSLASLVEKSQKCQPLFYYELKLTPTYLDLILQKQQPQQQHEQQLKNDLKTNDEGFESDIDTVSVISSDDGSLVSTTTTTTTTQQQQQQQKTTKTSETDSANGSASSDSDTSDHSTTTTTNNIRKLTTTTTTTTTKTKESYNLIDCVCYSDVRVPDVLLFVIKQEVFVFKFDNLLELRNFYLNFTAFKALTNQKTYNNNNQISNIYNSNVGNSVNNLKISGKFNLLQRTDNNGVTHIEITREPDITSTITTNTTNIINLNTPDIDYNHNNNNNNNNKYQLNENLVKLPDKTLTLTNHNSLRKVWNSADDLLGDSPKRPERRKRIKGRAPQPPIQQQQPPISDVLRGEYVRVNVNADTNKNYDFIAKSQLKDRSKLTNFVTLLTSKTKQPTITTTEQQLWTNSVPRLVKFKPKFVQNSKLTPITPAPQQRMRNEARFLPPMAYRYVDQLPKIQTTTNSISNRLFGLSSKLKDFHLESKIHSKWSSVGDISLKNDTNLKSVIKKDDTRKKNDKKVTFSAYTTVQVV